MSLCIDVQSEVGKGTDFVILLPTIDRKLQSVKSNETVIKKGKEQILYINDEPALGDIGKKYLENLGYHVTTVTDPLNALEIFRKDANQFDLVISTYSGGR